LIERVYCLTHVHIRDQRWAYLSQFASLAFIQIPTMRRRIGTIDQRCRIEICVSLRVSAARAACTCVLACKRRSPAVDFGGMATLAPKKTDEGARDYEAVMKRGQGGSGENGGPNTRSVSSKHQPPQQRV